MPGGWLIPSSQRLARRSLRRWRMCRPARRSTLSRRIPRCWPSEERFRGEDTRRVTGSRKMPDTFSSATTPGGDPTATPIMRLGHLYPDQLNMYGDRGNIIVLHERCAWRGVTLQVTPLDLGEPLDPAAYD